MTPIEVVDIYLPTQVESPTEWIHALSIPRKDIERLTFRPLKWLRFATFTVCGAKGDLSATQGGEAVDYENTSSDNLADTYYYSPDGLYHLVDYQAFNEQCTSSAATPRRSDFRDNICRRDDTCVITQCGRDSCDAAHIISNRKGSGYITYVVRDRFSLYEPPPFSLGPEGDVDIDINCAENGILLRRDLHADLGRAAIAFLKTPNFATAPADVPRIEKGPIPHSRTTLQYIEPPTGRGSVPQWDIQADWSRDEVPPPPSILLDYMYGVAVAKRWKCDPLRHMLEKRFADDFSRVLAENPRRSASEDDESEVEPDNPKGPDWLPRKSTGKQKERKTFSSDAKAGVLEAMDYVLYLSMMLKGVTPQSMAAESEKRRKEKELRSQEQSVQKVRQWLSSDASTHPL